MKHRLTFLATLTTLMLAMFAVGCATLQQLATTQPALTPADRIAAAQSDLDNGWRLAQDAHLAGLLSDKQFNLIANQYPVAQSSLNLAGVAADGKTPDAMDLIDAAAKAVAAFRNRVPAQS